MRFKCANSISTSTGAIDPVQTFDLWREVPDEEANDYELRTEFSDILENILTDQAKRLINGGLYNKFNSTITKLMLTKHGYVERSEQDITSKGEQLKTSPVDEDLLASFLASVNDGTKR